jgi:hypothetical protein
MPYHMPVASSEHPEERKTEDVSHKRHLYLLTGKSYLILGVGGLLYWSLKGNLSRKFGLICV